MNSGVMIRRLMIIHAQSNMNRAVRPITIALWFCVRSASMPGPLMISLRPLILTPVLSRPIIIAAMPMLNCSRAGSALQDYSAALAIDPGYTDALYNRGLLHAELGLIA